MAKNIFFIGISGASASGKTAFAQSLCHSFPSQCVCVISADNYYKDQSHLSFEEREKMNHDHPDIIDYELMIQHIQRLKKNESIHIPVYDYASYNRTSKTNLVQPANIIIFEGILLFYNKTLRSLFDLRLYVDTPLDICLIRRLQRDISTRGYTMESIIEQYTTYVRPMFLKYIQPSRQYADLIIPHGGKNQRALDLINAKIKSLLQITSNDDDKLIQR